MADVFSFCLDSLAESSRRAFVFCGLSVRSRCSIMVEVTIVFFEVDIISGTRTNVSGSEKKTIARKKSRFATDGASVEMHRENTCRSPSHALKYIIWEHLCF